MSVNMWVIFEHFDSRRMHVNFDFVLFLDILFDFKTTAPSKQRMGMVFNTFQDLTNLPFLKS